MRIGKDRRFWGFFGWKALETWGGNGISPRCRCRKSGHQGEGRKGWRRGCRLRSATQHRLCQHGSHGTRWAGWSLKPPRDARQRLSFETVWWYLCVSWFSRSSRSFYLSGFVFHERWHLLTASLRSAFLRGDFCFTNFEICHYSWQYFITASGVSNTENKTFFYCIIFKIFQFFNTRRLFMVLALTAWRFRKTFICVSQTIRVDRS